MDRPPPAANLGRGGGADTSPVRCARPGADARLPNPGLRLRRDVARMTTLPTSAQLVEVFHAALTAGDADGIEAVLRVLVVVDPRKAVEPVSYTHMTLPTNREVKI